MKTPFISLFNRKVNLTFRYFLTTILFILLSSSGIKAQKIWKTVKIDALWGIEVTPGGMVYAINPFTGQIFYQHTEVLTSDTLLMNGGFVKPGFISGSNNIAFDNITENLYTINDRDNYISKYVTYINYGFGVDRNVYGPTNTNWVRTMGKPSAIAIDNLGKTYYDNIN